jgi:superfamily II DNA or RNA helicase
MPPAQQVRSLVLRFASEFSLHTRQRGRVYFNTGRVDILSSDEFSIDGEVEGSDCYTVEVLLNAVGNLGLSCTCPAFAKYGPCKHLWAFLLEIDELESNGTAKLPIPNQDQPSLLRDVVFGTPSRSNHRPQPVPARPPWESRLHQLRVRSGSLQYDPWSAISPATDQLYYSLDLEASAHDQRLTLRPFVRRRKKDGEWGVGKAYSPTHGTAKSLRDPVDRRIFAALYGAREQWSYSRDDFHHRSMQGGLFILGDELCQTLLPTLCGTGRLYLFTEGHTSESPLGWDDDGPWTLRAVLGRDEGASECTLNVELERGEERMPVTEPEFMLEHGLLLARGALATFDARGGHALVREVRRNGPLRAPAEHEARFIQTLTGVEGEVFDDLRPMASTEANPPERHLSITTRERRGYGGRTLECVIRFVYAGTRVAPQSPSRLIADKNGEFTRRDFEFETAALVQFQEAGGRHGSADSYEDRDGTVAAGRMPELVRTLMSAGWHVSAEGSLLRTAGAHSISVRSGQDWFDLEGGLEFGDQVASLPALLEAARTKQRTVKLGDGSSGILPENWLASWGLLELAGKVQGESVRFARHQGWLLDALLAEREGVQVDLDFKRMRRSLSKFTGLKPRKEPRGFHGELREYQREGLGWFKFLRDLGLGGCLADDMGLGKTVQVLALLEARRLTRRKRSDGDRPSLVVAPRSLIFNWIDEATRFAPRLKTLDYTGPGRKAQLEGPFERADLVLTTYGTLRRDAAELAQRRFDYVILDEAQAIKNATSQSAKAARLLVANHRLALSGTPIENHLGELWSLFEYLNPGMLGRSTPFKAFVKGHDDQDQVQDFKALGRAIRPFFLRRTKEQVLKDLPPKTEQTLVCDLTGKERREYEQIRDHFRAALLSKESESGLGSMKIQVLEALLRLRQAACHPGLMDERRQADSSAKLDMLLPMLEEVVEGGHKALVFSQFTKLLAIVRQRLEAKGITYEYLDGRTRKRKEKVERFQNDDSCPLFLISLKAGGQGLNLTASDYVFLLDPWWNPAVEAQAIDRAHRIGRTKPVVAYRLIARDTVEEKVVELQARKRELADAILSGGGSVIRDLTREDLERILS